MTLQKPKGLRKLALAATAVFSACQMMAFVLYPYFSEATGLSLTFIVGSFSVGSFLFLWGSPFWVRQIEQKGSRWALGRGILGLLGSQIVLLFLLLGAGQIPLILAATLLVGSRILYGLTASAIVPVSQTIMAASSGPAERMQAMVRHNMSLHLGRVMGPLVVWLGLFVSPTTPLWICLGLLMILSLFLGRESNPQVPKVSSGISSNFLWPNSKASRLLILMAFVLTVLVGILQSSLTQHLQNVLHLDSQRSAQISLQFLLASSLVTVVIQLLMQGRIKNPWQGTLPLGALCLAISVFLLVEFQREAELWWALPLFAAGVALLTPSYTAALSLREDCSQQGSVAGLLGATHTLGYAAGGMLTAALLSAGIKPLVVALSISIGLLLLVITAKDRSEHNLKTLTRDQP